MAIKGIRGLYRHRHGILRRAFASVVPAKASVVQWFKGGTSDKRGNASFPTTERYAGKKWDGDGSARIEATGDVYTTGSLSVELVAVKASDNAKSVYEIADGTQRESSFKFRSVGENRELFQIVDTTLTTREYELSQATIGATYKLEVLYESGRILIKVNDLTEYDEAVAWVPRMLGEDIYIASDRIGEIVDGEIHYIDLNGHTFPFEMEADTNFMNSIPPTGEEPITGTIINNDKARIVADDSVEQYFNPRGGARAKALGKNLFNKDTVVDGFRYDNTGTLVVDPVKSVSPLIYVKGFSDVVFEVVTGSGSSYNVVFDKDKNVLATQVLSNGVNSISLPSNAVFVALSLQLSEDKSTIQLEQGTTPTTYEAWKGYHYTNDGLNPVPDGNVGIKTDDGDLNFYLANGDRASVVYHGPVRADKRVVDGVVDLLSSSFSDSNTTKVLTRNSITVTSDGTSATANSNISSIISDNTQKTIVFKANNLQGADNPVVRIRTLAGATITDIVASVNNQEYRTLFTPTDGGYRLVFFANFGTADISINDFYDFAVYEGDYVTGSPTLPTSGQPVQGNSTISYDDPVIKREADANVGLTNDGFDRTDPTALVAKVLQVPATTTNDSDQRFSRIEDGALTEEALYEAPQTGSTLTKILAYFGL